MTQSNDRERAEKVVSWLRQCPPIDAVVVGFIAEKFAEIRQDEKRRILKVIRELPPTYVMQTSTAQLIPWFENIASAIESQGGVE